MNFTRLRKIRQFARFSAERWKVRPVTHLFSARFFSFSHLFPLFFSSSQLFSFFLLWARLCPSSTCKIIHTHTIYALLPQVLFFDPATGRCSTHSMPTESSRPPSPRSASAGSQPAGPHVHHRNGRARYQKVGTQPSAKGKAASPPAHAPSTSAQAGGSATAQPVPPPPRFQAGQKAVAPPAPLTPPAPAAKPRAVAGPPGPEQAAQREAREAASARAAMKKRRPRPPKPPRHSKASRPPREQKGVCERC